VVHADRAGLVQALDVQPGERVLDVGCGRGAALVPLAAATGPTGSVLGIDLAPRMVELTAADVAHLPHVQVRLADATAPGLAAQSYDVISCCLVLFFLPDPAAAVRTWRELLVDGGRMGVTTFRPQDERWKAVDTVFAPYRPAGVRDPRTTGSRGPFASDEGMEGLLTEAGMREVRTAAREVTATFRDPQQWVEFSWSHGQRAMWESVPASEQGEVRQHLVELLEGFRSADGTLGFHAGDPAHARPALRAD